MAELDGLVGDGCAREFLHQVMSGLRYHGRVELLVNGRTGHPLLVLDRRELTDRLVVLALEHRDSTTRKLTDMVRAGPFANVTRRDVNRILFQRPDLFAVVVSPLEGAPRWKAIAPDPGSRQRTSAQVTSEPESDAAADHVGGEADEHLDEHLDEHPEGPVLRRHRDSTFLAGKLTRLDEPHVQPLTLLCRQQEKQWGREVPLVDPESGGTSAKVLVLLESPGPRASSARGSGLISFDNDDATAANGLQCLLDSGLPRYLTVNWNIVPWYMREVRTPTDDELEDASPALEQFLRLLPRLEVVILLGKTAERGWVSMGLDRPGLAVLRGPHPSPQNFNTRPGSRLALVDVFRRAAGLIGE